MERSPVQRLHKAIRDGGQVDVETTNDQRRHNEDDKENKHDEVQDGVTDYATTTELGLLQ